MNTQSAGNDYLKIFDQTGSVLETANHFNVSYSTMWARLKSAGRVSVKKKPVYSSTLNKEYFYNIDSAHKAYFYGFIKADGYIDKKRNRLAIRIQERDDVILKRFCDAVNLPLKRINTIITKDNQQIHKEVAITNEKFVLPLLNIKNNESLDPIIRNDKFVYDFIRGYFDGDGCINYRDLNKQSYQLNIMGSPEDDHVLQFIKNYFPNFHLYIDKRSNLPLLKTGSKFEILDFANKVYTNCNVYLPRKKQKFDQIRFLNEVRSSTTTRGTSFKEDEDIV